MARAVEKKRKVGFALKINRTGQQGADHWERVGFCFQSRLEALEYKKKHYPSVMKFTITGIRLVMTTLRDGRTES